MDALVPQIVQIEGRQMNFPFCTVLSFVYYHDTAGLEKALPVHVSVPATARAKSGTGR